jgi:hypothetical protein
MLMELQASLYPLPAVDPPPKDLNEAVSNINKEIAKMQPPPKNPPDLAKVAEQATAPPPPPVESVNAPSEPQAKAS